MALEGDREPVIVHLSQRLLVLLLGTVTADDEHLELGGGRILIRLLDEVSERLQEAVAGRTVLGREKHCNMRSLCPH